MNWVAAGGGFIGGTFWASCAWYGVHRRLCARIVKHSNLENEAQRLEKRREALDSGLTDKLPPLAGHESGESEIFSTHPGTMALSHLETKRSENLTKVFDTSGLSSTIDGVRVESDQPINDEEGQ